MKKTPLFAAHLARNAGMEVVGPWMVAAHFAGVEAEVAAVRAGAGLFDLCAVESLRLRGPELRRWTNGMFTNNTRKLQPGQGNRHALCDDRGRVRALADLYWVAEEEVVLVLEGWGVADFTQAYEMYLTLDDIEVEPIPGEPSLLSLQGPGAAAVLAAVGLPVPAGDHDHVELPGDNGGLRLMRRDRTGLGGVDLLVPRAILNDLWEALLRAGASPVGRDAAEALRVWAGLAAWPVDGGEKTLVHELLIDKEVCAFDKGCYVGQEVLNRVDLRGSIQKRLTGVLLAEDALPPSGARVMQGDEEVGALTSLARIDGKVVGIGILRKAAWEPGSALLVVAGERAVPAHTAALPFAP